MAFDAFLVFDSGNTVSIKGEATRKGFENAIEIEDFSFDVENAVSIGSQTGGAGVGKVKFNPFQIRKRPDLSSPMFFQHCAAGTHFQKVSILLNKAGGTTSVTYLKFTFSTVFVSKVSWSGETSSDTPVEDITFEYGSLEIQYTPQKSDGTSGSPVVGGWNRILNTKSPS